MGYRNKGMGYRNKGIGYRNKGMGYRNKGIGYRNKGMGYRNTGIRAKGNAGGRTGRRLSRADPDACRGLAALGFAARRSGDGISTKAETRNAQRASGLSGRRPEPLTHPFPSRGGAVCLLPFAAGWSAPVCGSDRAHRRTPSLPRRHARAHTSSRTHRSIDRYGYVRHAHVHMCAVRCRRLRRNRKAKLRPFRS
jgi:hypothetical protein